MEVVIEETLIITFCLCFMILNITALIMKSKCRFSFLSSLASSIFSLVAPIYILPIYLKGLLLLCSATLILLLSFKFTSFKNFLLTGLIFMTTTFVFGGGILAFKQLIGSFPLMLVVVIAFVIFIAVRILIKSVNHHRRLKKFTYNLTFIDGDKVVKEEGYLDSGNVLYDTITKKPIVLVTFEVFQKFYSDITLSKVLTKNFTSSSIKNGHYIKINSVGKGTSILVFTVDKLTVDDDNREFKNVSLGLSFAGFEKSFGKNVLLHSDFC